MGAFALTEPGNRFDAVPVAGEIRIRRNMLVRSGSFDPNWRHGVGALWFYALDHPISAAIRVSHLEIRDPVEEAILFTGSRVATVSLAGITITGTANFLVARSSGVAELNAGGTLGPTPRARLCNPEFHLTVRSRSAQSNGTVRPILFCAP
jgi:hypothetical protein